MSDSVDYSLALLLHLNFLSEQKKKKYKHADSGSPFVLLTNWHPEALVISILGAVLLPLSWMERDQKEEEEEEENPYEMLMNGLDGLVLALIFLMLFLFFIFVCVMNRSVQR